MKKIIRTALSILFIFAIAYFAAKEVSSVAWKARFWYCAGFISFIMISGSLYAALDEKNISGRLRKLAEASNRIAMFLMIVEIIGWAINTANLVMGMISDFPIQFSPALSAILGWPSFLSIFFLMIWITEQENSITAIENQIEHEQEERDRLYGSLITIDEKIDRMVDRLTS